MLARVPLFADLDESELQRVASVFKERRFAQGETVIYVEHGGRSYRGAAVSTNIVEASVNALLEVINRIELAQRNASRQPAV